MAKTSAISNGYARMAENLYRNSKLGKSFTAIAICEVVRLPSGQYISENVYVRNPKTGKREMKIVQGILNESPQVITLSMEEAVIVRFILVNFGQVFDIFQNPPSNPPSINDILKSYMKNK